MNPAVPLPFVVGAIGLDLLWWRVADRSARGARWPVALRAGLLLVALLQAGWVLEFARAVPLDGPHPSLAALDVANLAWHAILVPGVLVGASVRWGLGLRGRPARSSTR